MDEQKGVFVPALGLTVKLPEGEGDAVPLLEGLKTVYSPDECAKLEPKLKGIRITAADLTPERVEERIKALAARMAKKGRPMSGVISVNRDAGKFVVKHSSKGIYTWDPDLHEFKPLECPECFRQDDKHNSRCPRKEQ